MTALLAIALGAMFGACARFLTDRAIQFRLRTAFPWGTLTVNIAGSLILGLLAGAASVHDLPNEVVAAVGVGFCGALTTYSTFAYETMRLAAAGRWRYAVGNVVISIAAGLGAASIGLAIGQLI